MFPWFRMLFAGGLVAGATGAVAAVPLQGILRDFCAPSTANCTQLADFEGSIGDVQTGMVRPRLVSGLPVAGPRIGAGGSTPDNFAKWYADSPGYNLRFSHILNLSENSPGILSFDDSSFYPLDQRGYGNQDRIHNYHFTLHVKGSISFTDESAAADRFFDLSGDDDIWLFINGKLVVDLGGVHGTFGRSFTEETLKTMGMVSNRAYTMNLFFAERHTVDSGLHIRTSFDIAPAVPEPSAWALLGVGLFCLACRRRSSPCEQEKNEADTACSGGKHRCIEHS